MKSGKDIKICIIAIIAIIIVVLLTLLFLNVKFDKFNKSSNINNSTTTATTTKEVNNKAEIKNNLISIKESNKEYINQNNETILLKNNTLSTFEKTEVSKYAYVDFDEDGYEELIIETTSGAGIYYILHYSNVDFNYYGYEVGLRSLQEIKTDGSSKASGGAAYQIYSNGIIFDGTTMEIKSFAEYDQMNKIYKLNNIEVEKNEVDSYINKFNSKTTLQFN